MSPGRTTMTNRSLKTVQRHQVRPWTIEERIEADIVEKGLDRIRDYVVGGRSLAGLAAEELSERWVEAYRTARALGDERRESEFMDLRCEFDLRGIEPPMHLVAAESAMVKQRLERLVREAPIDVASVERAEAELAELYERLQAPKN